MIEIDRIMEARKRAIKNSDEKLVKHIEKRIGKFKDKGWAKWLIFCSCIVILGVLIALIALLVSKVGLIKTSEKLVIDRQIIENKVVQVVNNSTTIQNVNVVKHELPANVVGDCIMINSNTGVVWCNGKKYEMVK